MLVLLFFKYFTRKNIHFCSLDADMLMEVFATYVGSVIAKTMDTPLSAPSLKGSLGVIFTVDLHAWISIRQTKIHSATRYSLTQVLTGDRRVLMDAIRAHWKTIGVLKLTNCSVFAGNKRTLQCEKISNCDGTILKWCWNVCDAVDQVLKTTTCRQMTLLMVCSRRQRGFLWHRVACGKIHSRWTLTLFCVMKN